jgi:hypothetical protein
VPSSCRTGTEIMHVLEMHACSQTERLLSAACCGIAQYLVCLTPPFHSCWHLVCMHIDNSSRGITCAWRMCVHTIHSIVASLMPDRITCADCTAAAVCVAGTLTRQARATCAWRMCGASCTTWACACHTAQCAAWCRAPPTPPGDGAASACTTGVCCILLLLVCACCN